MAEGFARYYGGDSIEYTARVCIRTARFAKKPSGYGRSEVSILRPSGPKGIREYVLRDFDLIISMAPVPLLDWQGPVGEIYWDVKDPFRQPLKPIRKVRDEIEQKVKPCWENNPT